MHRLALALAFLACTSPNAFAQEHYSDVASTGEVVGPELPRPSIEIVSREDIASVQRRPAVLSGLYVSLAGLNALDLYSTSRALTNGAREINPLVAAGGQNVGAALALKTAATGASIYFVERLWKKNRAAAIATSLIVNGATAAVVAQNLRNAR